MDAPTEMRQRAALSDYLAAERTLLAWIRTGLALIVWVSYNSPAYLKERHGVPQELLQNIAVVERLAAKAAE
jgi:Domain of unknown function (DUF202)